MTIEQLESFSETKPELRYLTEEIIKYLQDNPGGGSGIVETIVPGTNVSVDDTDPANPIVSATGGAGILQTTSVQLADAQIKALPTTYIQVIAAPGANKQILLLGAHAKIDSAAGEYTNLDTDNGLLLTYGEWDIEASGVIELLGGNTVKYITFPPAAYSGQRVGWNGYLTQTGVGSSAFVVNKEIRIVGSNAAAGNFTGGNAANTMTITVYYVIVDV